MQFIIYVTAMDDYIHWDDSDLDLDSVASLFLAGSEENLSLGPEDEELFFGAVHSLLQ